MIHNEGTWKTFNIVAIFKTQYAWVQMQLQRQESNNLLVLNPNDYRARASLETAGEGSVQTKEGISHQTRAAATFRQSTVAKWEKQPGITRSSEFSKQK